MANIGQFVKRLVGTTLEDWILALMMLSAIGLTVLGVRSCEAQHIGHPPRLVEIAYHSAVA